MWFEASELRGVTVFKLSGNLKGCPDSYRFLNRIREDMSRQGKTRIIIDLGGVVKIDSAGIGILASIVTSAEVSGASLVFSSIAKRVEKMIVSVRLMRVLDVVPTLNDAIVRLNAQAVY